LATAAHNEIGQLDALRQRGRILTYAALALFAVIVVRLGWLQLARGGFYKDLSEDNYVQGFVVKAPRGLLLDRNGEILAESRAALSITLSRRKERDDTGVSRVLSELLDLEETLVDEKLAESRTRYYGSVVLVEDATVDQVARIEEHRSVLPGVKVEVTPARGYPMGNSFAAHAIGHVGQISDTELAQREPLGYSIGDVVGKTGIEKRYELMLRGQDGSEYWVCDAAGRELYPFLGGPTREARPGHNVVLTIDAPAQRVAEEALARHDGGAIVALEPATGEVLVLASSPPLDLNALATGLSADEWRALATSQEHPLMNRAIQATYPPGSPFKLVTAAAGLETRTVSRSETVVCRGAYKYGIRTFRCWRPEGHGVVDILKGIVESCDVFFYQVGARLGVARLMDWTERSGFGRKTGIDIGGEVDGNVPTPDWYDRHYGRRKWSKGVVINLAIGQGELLVTPLQTACYVAGLANGGEVVTPHLLKRIEGYSGRVLGTARTGVSHQLPYRASTLEFLRRAMRDVVETPRGTGVLARIEGMDVAGKTGTAQNPHGEDHAWFVCFAPADRPRIAMAVLVEHAGGGGAIAAPIARDVMRAYFRIADPDTIRRAPAPPSEETIDDRT